MSLMINIYLDDTNFFLIQKSPGKCTKEHDNKIIYHRCQAATEDPIEFKEYTERIVEENSL